MYQIDLDPTDDRLCVGYLRVSSKEQLQGYSIKNQDITIQRTASFLNVNIDKVYKDEAKSAFKQNVIRKDFENLINEIKSNKIKLLIVWKLDRLIRDHIRNEDLFQLFDKYNVQLLSCTENIDFTTADGRKEIRKKGVDNQYESERTSERVSEVLKASASLGNYPKSRVPIGFKRIHHEFKAAPLEIDKECGAKILHVFEMIDKNKWGVKRMLRWLNANHYMDIKWTEKLLYSLLTDVIYIGTYVNSRSRPTLVIENHTPALIPKELFTRIQQLIHSRNYDRKYDYVFKGFVYCLKCGKKLTPNPAHNGKSKKLYQYYHCEHCNKRINQDKLTNIMLTEIDLRIDHEINQVVLEELNTKIKRIEYLINENNKLLLDLVIDIDYHKKQQNQFLKEHKQLQKQIKKYKSSNKIYFEFLDYQGKRKWLQSNVIMIHFNFEDHSYKITYRT